MLKIAATALIRGFASNIVSTRSPDQIIGRGDQDVAYMERWYLLRKQATGPIENVYLHRFLRSDAEEPHDHPWAWATLVLSGSYVEWSPGGETVRKVGDVAFKSAEDKHAIISVEPGTMTLFVTGPKVREWGFWTDEGFVHWEDFDARRGVPMSGARKAAIEERERSAVASRPKWEPGDRTPGTIVIGGGLRKVVGADGKLHIQEK